MPFETDKFIPGLEMPRTPAEHLATSQLMRRELSALLAETPANCFVIVLRHPEREDWPLLVAATCSLGHYVGTIINAIRFYPPLGDIKLTGFRLSDGVEPRPELMLFRNALALAIKDCDEAIATWQKEIDNHV